MIYSIKMRKWDPGLWPVEVEEDVLLSGCWLEKDSTMRGSCDVPAVVAPECRNAQPQVTNSYIARWRTMQEILCLACFCDLAGIIALGFCHFDLVKLVSKWAGFWSGRQLLIDFHDSNYIESMNVKQPGYCRSVTQAGWSNKLCIFIWSKAEVDDPTGRCDQWESTVKHQSERCKDRLHKEVKAKSVEVLLL